MQTYLYLIVCKFGPLLVNSVIFGQAREDQKLQTTNICLSQRHKNNLQSFKNHENLVFKQEKGVN